MKLIAMAYKTKETIKSRISKKNKNGSPTSYDSIKEFRLVKKMDQEGGAKLLFANVNNNEETVILNEDAFKVKKQPKTQFNSFLDLL